MPNIEELRSIAALNCFNPAVNENSFPNVSPIEYWSSSPVANTSGWAWTYSFYSGYVSISYRKTSGPVRLVRNIQ